jgi:hypothetical protein
LQAGLAHSARNPPWRSLLSRDIPPFAGIPRVLADLLVQSLPPALYSRFAAGNRPAGVEIMAHQTLSQRMNAISGALLIALGLLLLFANLDALADTLLEGTGLSATEGVDTVLSVGLAAIHAVQSYTFEHSRFVSGVWQILVSFWPLILVVCGALLLRGAFGRLVSSFSASLGSFADGERS